MYFDTNPYGGQNGSEWSKNVLFSSGYTYIWAPNKAHTLLSELGSIHLLSGCRRSPLARETRAHGASPWSAGQKKKRKKRGSADSAVNWLAQKLSILNKNLQGPAASISEVQTAAAGTRGVYACVACVRRSRPTRGCAPAGSRCQHRPEIWS